MRAFGLCSDHPVAKSPKSSPSTKSVEALTYPEAKRKNMPILKAVAALVAPLLKSAVEPPLT